MNFNKFLQVSAMLFVLLFPLSVGAAMLYLDPQSQDVSAGDTFIEEVRLDTDEPINAVEIYLAYPADILRVADFSLGNSILTVIAQEPTVTDSGLISFSGGIPGGYSGRIPGDPEKSNLLGKIVFKALGGGEAEIKFEENSRVLLNDGLGTEADLNFQGASVNIGELGPGEIRFPTNVWQEELEKDTIPPEEFELQIGQDPSIFDGKYFLVFSTTDKQTGVDYWEVKEGEGDWQKTKSPFLLKDQTLRSTIKVKAVDKAGNERIVTVEGIKPPLEKPPFPKKFFVVIGLGVAVVGLAFIWLIRRIYAAIRKK